MAPGSYAIVDGWIYVLSPREVGECVASGARDVVMPLAEYERDLGMPSEAAVRRQLEVDLPRSLVRVDGARTTSADRVLGATLYPRMCTQACLAPVVEWLLHAGPLAVDVRGDRLDVRKRLGVRTWAGDDLGEVMVSVHADARRHTAVVSVHPRAPP